MVVFTEISDIRFVSSKEAIRLVIEMGTTFSISSSVELLEIFVRAVTLQYFGEGLHGFIGCGTSL